jgi:hypothetical protein
MLPSSDIQRVHSFGHILTKKPALARAFGPEKPALARTFLFVKFWTFYQKLVLFRRVPHKGRALNGPGCTKGFLKHALARGVKSKGF